MARVLILADDLTGAADFAAAFLGSAREVAVIFGPGSRARAEVAALDLDTRSRSEPGVPFGIAPDGTLVCTKADAFGRPDTLLRCIARLKREMNRK